VAVHEIEDAVMAFCSKLYEVVVNEYLAVPAITGDVTALFEELAWRRYARGIFSPTGHDFHRGLPSDPLVATKRNTLSFVMGNPPGL
jgi:hypothetical protein